jgi:RimJ/RimL family protein N-acetyltransferase
MEFRLATPEDVDGAQAVLLDATRWLLENNIRQWSLSNFERQKVESLLGTLYVALIGAEIVGVCQLMDEDRAIWPDSGPTDGVLHRFAIALSHRGGGTGRDVLRAAESQARSLGKTKLLVDCWANNARMNKYYRDAGYTPTGTRVVQGYVGPYEAAFLEKVLTTDQTSA